MTAYILAAIVAIGSVLWFFAGDDVRSHQSFSGLLCGMVFAAALVISHFVGW
jgi:hypothetical protein